MKIHISKALKELLDVTEDYAIVSRGLIDVKVNAWPRALHDTKNPELYC